jgi:hypothetical protein
MYEFLGLRFSMSGSRLDCLWSTYAAIYTSPGARRNESGPGGNYVHAFYDKNGQHFDGKTVSTSTAASRTACTCLRSYRPRQWPEQHPSKQC